VRRLAADCALQCHDFSLPALQGIENTTVNHSRDARKHKTGFSAFPARNCRVNSKL
jgi:hypothetical protein